MAAADLNTRSQPGHTTDSRWSHNGTASEAASLAKQQISRAAIPPGQASRLPSPRLGRWTGLQSRFSPARAGVSSPARSRCRPRRAP
eukprot:scaffold44040_cov69-Phaeocystis_antarctica.AAC.1